VDARGGAVTIRVNDEILIDHLPATGPGQIGVAARSAQAGQVVFSWVRVWGRQPAGK
jgi:hypothetical protein